jgi:hypothetical protein
MATSAQLEARKESGQRSEHGLGISKGRPRPDNWDKGKAAKDGRQTTLWIGFFGCYRLDRTVTVGFYHSHASKCPREALVACPCGETHEAGNFLWRKPRKREQPNLEVML